ncbi:taste receptor type 2 member 40-like [Eleutherodactylus coqui]|uniref:taste receptor type 2 member 40-like n=1 Tax=Eleutherodactylus coqui TaxID=57060 RepID=UPI003462C725
MRHRYNIPIQKPREPDPHTKLIRLRRNKTSYQILISEKIRIIVDMMNYLDYIFTAVLYMECIAGIMVNMTILAAIFLKWKTQRSLQTIYKILICLSLSRCLHLLSVLFIYIFSYYPWALLDKVIVVTIRVMNIFLLFTNFWFATVLCVFYCVKITSYNCKFWIFLKMKISTVIFWFLLASLLLSASSSLPFVFHGFNQEPQNLTINSSQNMTIYNNITVTNLSKWLLMFLVGSCPPFLIFCITICLLLHSLYLHIRRMRSSGSGFQSPNLESHISAVKSMSLFLVLQIIYFMLINVILSGKLPNYVLKVLASTITSSSSFLHSLYIISCNSELKMTCICMFHTLTGATHS